MLDIREVSQEMLNRLFGSNVVPRIQLLRNESYSTEFTSEEKTALRRITETKAAVVGIDIYQYSQFPTEKQVFIPHLFELIYNDTWHLIKQNYEFLFQQYGKLLEADSANHLVHTEYFISTGDGGYQILETPLHGIIFILTFVTVLRLYNSDRFMRKLHAKIEEIEVRYALTLDDIYRYHGEFYGAGIINNARILSRDFLNRFVMYQNAHHWFLSSILGIENLMSISLTDIKNIEDLRGYDNSKIAAGHNALIPAERDSKDKEGFVSIDVQKMGEVRQKGTQLDIYNVHIQALIHYKNLFEQEQIFTVSIGNLNTSGIGNEEA